jgi:serine/threonine-protein kinase
LVAFLATVGIIAITLALLKPNNVEVPSLEGMNAEQAAAKAEEEGLEVNRVEQASLDAPPGTVISQTPAAGALTNSGSEIRVVVSSGPPMAPVPAISGLAVGPATEALQNAKLEIVVADRVFSSTVPKGSIVSVKPEVGTEIAEGEAVEVVVSDGPEPVNIPAVTGKSESEAVIAIDNVGAETAITREFSDSVPSGVVIRVSADGETVVPGDTVTLVVSKGPDLVAVPSLEGLTQSEAEAAADGVVDLEVNTSRGRNFVWRQDPAAGTEVKRGTLVTIFL